MKQKSLTSRELLDAAGVNNDRERQHGDGFPIEHRHLLITSVLEFISGQKLRKVLRDHGVEVSTRDVLEWLSETREWLGLPPVGPGKPSARYRRVVEAWRRANGNPTLDEIDAGWVPAPVSDSWRESKIRKLSPGARREIKEFRRMLNELNEAKTDEEFQELHEEYLHQLDKERAILRLRAIRVGECPDES